MDSTILVVDDELENLRSANKLFGEEFHIEVAKSGEEALSAVEKCKPDLILLDVNMPGMDGHLVIQQLKANEFSRDIPVIFLTEKDDVSEELRGFKEGAVDFIQKPFREEVTACRIRRILQIVSLQKLLLAQVEAQTKAADEERRKVAEMSKDFLTGLNMRSLGEQEIIREMAESDGCLAFLDVDNLKKINDTIGHKFGDRVLKLMGDILTRYNESAISCRLGGDEFLYFMSDVSFEQAEKRINQILNDFLEQKEADASIRQASLSIGLCMCKHKDSYLDIYNKADKALYHVKQNGKAGYFFYQNEDYGQIIKNDVDLEQLVHSLKASGSYSGAMDLEYREFAKLYEYAGNLKERYHHGFHLVMITVNANADTIRLDDLESAMSCMESAIRENVRRLDIFTRYSSTQYLVILLEAGNQNIHFIMDRIFDKFAESCHMTNIQPSFSIVKVD